MNLGQFCSNRDTRYQITKTFIRNGWEYATDARIAVRIRAEVDADETPGNFPPNIIALFEEGVRRLASLIVMPPDKKEGEICSMCEGGGVLHYDYRACAHCDGDGTCMCSCPVEHECFSCGGSGGVYHKSKDCYWCEKSKQGYKNFKVYGKILAGHYISLACRELPKLRAVGLTKGDCVLLEFDGGQCIITPLKTNQ